MSVRVEEELLRSVKVKAAQEELTVKEIVARLLTAFVAGKIVMRKEAV